MSELASRPLVPFSMKKICKRLFSKLERMYAYSSPARYRNYLRRNGVKIGRNLFISGGVKDKHIDLTRPSLITIGDNVSINANFTLMTHDFVSGVFRNLYNDLIPSSGPVIIGNNVRFGVNCTVLKNVRIGDNVFIAAGSMVTKDIPSNCIAGGVPCKPIISLAEYYKKRQEQALEEAFCYARSIQERFGRLPVEADFTEEFVFFYDKDHKSNYQEAKARRKLLGAYDKWIENHVAPFESFHDFLVAAGVNTSE